MANGEVCEASVPPGLFNRGNSGRRLCKEPLGTWPAPAKTPSAGGRQPGWDRCLTPRARFQCRSEGCLPPCVRGLAQRPVSPASLVLVYLKGCFCPHLSSAPLLTASGQDGLAQATSGFFVEGGNDFGQKLSACSVGSAA